MFFDIKTQDKELRRRNWVFTVNNPQQAETELLDYFKTLAHIKYVAFGREKGGGTEENPDGTIHYQGYIEFSEPKNFTTIKGYFSEPSVKPNAHFEPRKGTRKQAHDYVFKINEYADKAHTKIGDIFYFGEFVEDGERTDISQLKELIEEGASDIELADTSCKAYAQHLQFVDRHRQNLIKEKYGKTRRLNLEVTYIYGSSGIGKTRYIMDTYGDENVYRVTDYDEIPFDNYDNEDIVVFEEFRSQIRIDKMLNYLDVYPLRLRARYNNKIACFTKVFIVSNWKPYEQYKNVQKEYPSTWIAFKRRIHKIFDFDKSKTEPIPNEQAFKPPLDLVPLSKEEQGELPF